MYNEQTTQQILARYTEKRKVAQQKEQKEEHNEQLDAYLQAAAVLHCFNPATLRPLQAQYEHEDVRLLLYDYIVKTAGSISEGLFSLKIPIRHQMLKKLATRGHMLQALQANPGRIRTDMQRMFETYLNNGGDQFRPQEMSYQQLTLYYQLLTWLNGIDASLPSLPDVMQLLPQKSIMAAFEHLVDKNFTGRRVELAAMRNYIMNRDTPYSRPKKILSVSGPGGIGKSALVAQLLIENTLCEDDKKILFAYLAFDQPVLRIESPFTIILEAVNQLELQLPEHKQHFENFRKLVGDYRDNKTNIISRDSRETTRSKRIDRSIGLETYLYQQFGILLWIITNGGRRTFLLVLDTFEEVEYRDKESLSAFWYMLEEIRESFKWFNVIIAGRTPIREILADSDHVGALQLERLHHDDSVHLLTNLGVTDARMADMVASKVGGNPLSLRLAANLIVSLKDDGEIRNMESLSLDLDEQLIQGYLYGRILNHIHDDNVRKLAHPGMVLRVVSPDVILNVLASVCELEVNDIEEATRLFEELKREHALVKIGPEGTLFYRPEIRQAMVRLLTQNKYAQVQQIHREAIYYYSGIDTIEARAEEMYHRLASGRFDTYELDQRWKEGIEKSVVQNLEEYTDQGKAWLASRMSLEVDRKIFENVSTADWERNIVRKVQTALSRNNTRQALALLSEREKRTPESPLFVLEARALLLEERLDKAAQVLNAGIELMSESNNRGRLAELLWLRAQVDLLWQKPSEADRLLGQAEMAISGAVSPVATIHILCHRLAIADMYHTGTPESIYALRKRLNDACKGLSFDYKYADGFVIRMARFYLQNEYPGTFQQIGIYDDSLQGPTMEMLTNENLRGLDEYRDNWEIGDSFEMYESLA